MGRIKSIQTKIGAYLIAIITAILGLFGGYQYITIKTELTTELHELATISASRLAEQLAEPIWNYDPLQAENILRSYMIDKRCYALVVFEPTNKMFKGVQRDAAWQVVLVNDAVAGNFITSSQEIVRDTKNLGRVDVSVTSRFIKERLRSEIVKIGLTVIVLDLALLGFLIFTLRTLLIRPINHLLTSTTAISQGDFRQDIQIRQDDEIGKLAAEFRKMLAYMQDMANAAARIAEGDVRQEIVPRSEQDVLGNAFQRMTLYANAAARIAEGDLRQEIVPRSEHDVLGNAFKRMTLYLKQISIAAEALAEGDLCQEFQVRSEHDLLGQTFRNMGARLNDIVLGVKAAAEHVSMGSRDLTRTAEQTSQGTSQQAAAAEEVSASMEEMVAIIRQNMENTKMTEKIALESSEDAQKGGIAVTQTIEAMQAIAERISIIQEIASQTNMLSLNATIEAAKAQDFGKGFAVVAAEVRELARRTREAAEEIDQLVRSCKIVSEEAGAILQRLVPNSQRTAELIQEISAASSEQYIGVEQINKAVQQLDTVIQQHAATSEEMATAAEELASQSEQLQSEMAFFTVREKSSTSHDQETALKKSLHDLLAAFALDEQQSTQLINTIIALKHQEENPAPDSKEDDSKSSVEESTSPQKSGETMPLRDMQDEVDADFERF